MNYMYILGIRFNPKNKAYTSREELPFMNYPANFPPGAVKRLDYCIYIRPDKNSRMNSMSVEAIEQVRKKLSAHPV